MKNAGWAFGFVCLGSWHRLSPVEVPQLSPHKAVRNAEMFRSRLGAVLGVVRSQLGQLGSGPDLDLSRWGFIVLLGF